ncbi:MULTISPECIES: hypothetical protein [unclassified Streptomyces]|uniref:hypothetical protein n=1 Tax=unclassified Streptomyces TaxID=2593676 RepID=UPI002259BBD4|nr:MULTISPECIES: hypothetical protein [unclassified Streptomyces]MCX4527032.1 hypothetical protein [Streptomyces sp. NBC_01551]MCX4542408.1 hypothetical protein [Streptomyces sp. NBC_01565]
MLTETTGRTPQDLAAELANLRAVDDWPSVWSGPPEGGSGEFTEWCGRYGWEPLTFDRQLRLRTPGGGSWTFFDRVGGQWSPLASLVHWAWQPKADAAAENSAVFDTAAATWPAYLRAAEGVLGTPTWTGAWDAADFPEPPHPSYWSDREERVLDREPYRFAYWAPGSGVPGLPFIVLTQSVTFPTWTTDMPGGSAISLEVYPPAEFTETGP